MTVAIIPIRPGPPAAQVPALPPATGRCDPARIETLKGYWLGRASVRAAEALRRTGDAAVPADDDLRQHRLASEYEQKAKECRA